LHILNTVVTLFSIYSHEVHADVLTDSVRINFPTRCTVTKFRRDAIYTDTKHKLTKPLNRTDTHLKNQLQLMSETAAVMRK